MSDSAPEKQTSKTVIVAKRILFGALMILILTGWLYLDGRLSSKGLPSDRLRGFGFAVLVVLLVGRGAIEIRRLIQARQLHVDLRLIVPAIFAMVLQPYWFMSRSGTRHEGLIAVVVILSVSLFLAAFIQAQKFGTDKTMANLGANCFSLIYLGLNGWFLVAIRLLGARAEDFWGQMGAIIMFIAVVKAADIGAYFTGILIGRRKWVPSISPAKTWEGLIGGIALAVITASIFANYSGIMYNLKAVFFGVAVGLSGQFGDLIESMLKRDAGSKDSASLIPEFGGVLDVLDSPLLAAPIAYMLFQWWML